MYVLFNLVILINNFVILCKMSTYKIKSGCTVWIDIIIINHEIKSTKKN